MIESGASLTYVNLRLALSLLWLIHITLWFIRWHGKHVRCSGWPDNRPWHIKEKKEMKWKEKKRKRRWKPTWGWHVSECIHASLPSGKERVRRMIYCLFVNRWAYHHERGVLIESQMDLIFFKFSFAENDVCEIFNGIKQVGIECSSRLFMLDGWEVYSHTMHNTLSPWETCDHNCSNHEHINKSCNNHSLSGGHVHL